MNQIILIDSQYQTDGHAPYKVLADDYEFYVLKLPNNALDTNSIQREVICHFLLNNWKITTPNFNWLQIPPEFKNEIKQPIFLEQNFGSSFIENAIDLSMLFSFSKKVNRREIENLNDLFLIALFDIWTMNDDRKPSNNNLLLSPLGSQLQITAIDHAFTFGTMNFKDLKPELGTGFSFNDSILATPFGKTLVKQENINQDWITAIQEKFYLCTQRCKNRFSEVSQFLSPETQLDKTDEEALTNFLFNKDRNKQVFELFCSIVNDIKK